MWTGDGRVFFYNPSQRLSLWEKPEELLGRADVDKLIQGKPDVAQGMPRQREREREREIECVCVCVCARACVRVWVRVCVRMCV